MGQITAAGILTCSRAAKSLASRQACKTEETKMLATKPWPLLLRQQLMPFLCLRVRTVLDLKPCVAVVFVYPYLAFCHDSFEVPLADVLEELLARAVDVLGILPGLVAARTFRAFAMSRLDQSRTLTPPTLTRGGASMVVALT